MTAQLISDEAVAVLLQSDEASDPKSAGELVQRLLKEAGLAPWEDMEIELFPGADGTLLMARRANLVCEGYAFHDFEVLVSATGACPVNWPSQLWSYNGAYYLLLRRPVGEESPDMNEFCLCDSLTSGMIAHILEHGKALIPSRAVELMQKNFA